MLSKRAGSALDDRAVVHGQFLRGVGQRDRRGGHGLDQFQNCFGGNARAFGHRRHLGPDHIGIDRGLADPGTIAAIAAGDDILAADQLGVAADALRDQFGMLDEVRLRFDHAGDQHLAGRQLHGLEHGVFVGMARIGGLQRDGVRPRLENDVDDVGERHVVMVRALVIAPAQMQADLLGRDVPGRVIERLDVQLDALAERLEIEVGVLDVPAHAEIGAIDLQHDAGFGDGLVFVTHRIGDGVDVGFEILVMVVAEEQRHHAGGSGAHESLGRLHLR